MIDLNYCSDYGSGGSSFNNSSTWATQGSWPHPTNLRPTSASLDDLVNGRCTLEDIMKEFRMNGLDSPYNPDEDRIWANPATGLSGLGPASALVRQKSWPAPDSSPAPPLAAAARRERDVTHFPPKDFASVFTPIEEAADAPSPSPSEAQLQALYSLPDAVVYSLLRDLERHSHDGQKRSRKLITECRFCKNNGERECYYRSHALKDEAGRVTCPVLRAFVCSRCGASGDAAHTIKYCPLSTSDERSKSTAILRSVRMASGKRRIYGAPNSNPATGNYIVFGEPTPSVVADNETTFSSPLDPLWAALEKKLLL